MDDDVAVGGELAVGVAEKLHVPARVGVLVRRAAAAWQPRHLPPKPRRAVQPRELLVERAHRLGLQPRDDALEPRVFGRREIHGVPARSERRVLQRLEILAHVVDDRVDQISRGPAGDGHLWLWHNIRGQDLTPDYDAEAGWRSSGIDQDFPNQAGAGR